MYIDNALEMANVPHNNPIMHEEPIADVYELKKFLFSSLANYPVWDYAANGEEIKFTRSNLSGRDYN